MLQYIDKMASLFLLQRSKQVLIVIWH